MLGEDLSVSGAGELGSAIGVEDKGLELATLAQGHAQCGDDQWGIEELAHGPTDYSPAKDIQDRDQIQPALSGEHAGGIADPDLVGASHNEACAIG